MNADWKWTVLRCLQASALLVWGTVLLYFSSSGRVASYLHPSFHGPLLVAGCVMGILALVVLFNRDALWCCGDPSCPERPPGLGRSLGAWFVLVVPILVAAVVSPSHFGAATVWNRGIVSSIDELPMLGTQSPFHEPALPGRGGEGVPWANDPSMDSASYLARTPEGRIRAETIDLMFAAQEPPLQKDFDGKEVEILGQYLPSRTHNARGDRFHLIRIFIMCCAADGRPLGITVQAPKLPDLPEMSWVRVRGVASFPVEGGKQIPLVKADSIEEVDPPAETFLY